MKFTQIPSDTFEKLQLNAGILLDEFTPATGTVGNILGATTGGISFTDNITFTDFGDDVDNCPKNTKELKKVDSHEVRMSGSFVTLSATTVKLLTGAADNTSGHIVPRTDLKASDFDDLWWVGDYSDVNTGSNAGYLAIHLMNALNTGGFRIQSTDKGKGTFAFDFLGHYSIDNPDTIPFEIYIKAGTAGA